MNAQLPPPLISRRFCIAPMMDWTDRHCWNFLRLLSRHALLYTEMVSTGALLHGDTERLLHFDASEQPLALQLGGSDPKQLAACSRLGEQAGYAEINLNVGCPSDRVQHHRMGACLMADPALVGDCLKAMQDAVDIPVTIKCRIGIDARDSFAYLAAFVDEVERHSACRTWIIHARIALLQGLSPKENREIPPLQYERVYRLKQAFPTLEVIINGGITSLDDCLLHLANTDGVMLGRAAYHNPWLLHEVDERLFGTAPASAGRHAILESYYPYVSRELAAGVPLHHMSRHILGLFAGCNGGKRFRRYLSEHACRPEANLDTLRTAAALVAEHSSLEEVN
ncbi:MAG TPA: tRNA dihydrouridine(20/20a) synthase DusA [Pseudomonadaceae bacterium]|nr:tRNA dihydrouridine(20/20a) synthase DusA [Pseudomonadaceae bacterium]